jgi:hypothetical protein
MRFSSNPEIREPVIPKISTARKREGTEEFP